MITFGGKQLVRKLCTRWRTFTSKAEKEPYWRAKFPDGARTFEAIPTITEGYNPRDITRVAEGWFKKYGHVVKQPMPFGTYTVHLFHFEDFSTVYENDGKYPARLSHHALAQYRRERKHLYDNVGLGSGNGEEWAYLRETTSDFISKIPSSHDMLEQVVDDLIKVIHNNVNVKSEIELLPWLLRWAFESIGVFTLHRRLNALSESGNERADKLVAAASLTDEIIALTTMDPVTDYEERYKQLVEAQDFIYSEMRKCLDDIIMEMELEPEAGGVAQTLLQNKACSEKDAITVILDLFQGASQTAPLTALMAFYNLARHPDVQAKLREDVKHKMPTKNSRFRRGTPAGLLSKVIIETMRLNPPIIGNGRIIQKDLVLGGYSIPAYTNVVLHYQVACLQEENFKDARKFIPERDDRGKTGFLFGGSTRQCPGRFFANNQLLMLIAKLILNFEFSYDGGEVRLVNQLHNTPEKPLILRLKPVQD